MLKFGLPAEEEQQSQVGQARFIVFGVGGGGGNAVDHMVNQGIEGISYVCANSDAQALNKLIVPNKIQMGEGLGAGGNPEVGKKLAEESEDEIRSFLKGYHMVFITAGMGGGTGTGAAPVVARIAKEEGLLTVAVVTTPFEFEGKKRAKAAQDGVEQLSQYVDSIITVPNQKLLQVYRQMTMRDAFRKADDVLLHAVNGLAQIVISESYINIDFNDIRTAMTAKGHAMMGVGRASGENRAREATEKAIRSPLLGDLKLENAKGLIISIASSEIQMNEPIEVASVVDSIIDLEDGNIFYGLVEDPSLGDDIHITVIATGLTIDDSPKPVVQPAVVAQTPPSDHVSAIEQNAAANAQTQAAAPKLKMPTINVGSYLKDQQKND